MTRTLRCMRTRKLSHYEEDDNISGFGNKGTDGSKNDSSKECQMGLGWV